MPVGLTITNKQVTEIEWETGPRDWRVSILANHKIYATNNAN
jgi:hypothetical protein